jgi:hypothetical protein
MSGPPPGVFLRGAGFGLPPRRPTLTGHDNRCARRPDSAFGPNDSRAEYAPTVNSRRTRAWNSAAGNASARNTATSAGTHASAGDAAHGGWRYPFAATATACTTAAGRETTAAPRDNSEYPQGKRHLHDSERPQWVRSAGEWKQGDPRQVRRRELAARTARSLSAPPASTPFLPPRSGRRSRESRR